MKKSLLFVVGLFLTFSLHAQIPAFLEDWIFPSNYDFSKFTKIPDVPGKPFVQSFGTKTKESWFTVNNDENSKGVMPPYLVENNYCNWGDDFESVYMKSQISNLFYAYKGYESSIDEVDGYHALNFMKRIVLQHKDAPHFFIILYFPKKYNYTLTKLTVQYRDSKHKVDLSPKDYFIGNKQFKWARCSNTEQKAIAYSGELIINAGFLNTDFQLSSQKKDANIKEFLKNSWNVASLDDFEREYKRLSFDVNKNYRKKLSILEKYKDENVLDVADKEKLSMIDTSELIFVKEMKDVLGKHGLEAFDLARQIMLIRFAVAAGFIDKKDALNRIEPVVYEISKKYVNYEDFISHLFAGRAFLSVSKGNYYNRVKNSHNNLYTLERTVGFVGFDGTDADKNHVMDYSVSWYEPSDEYQLLSMVLNDLVSGVNMEESSFLDKAIEEYGNYSFLVDLRTYSNLPWYDPKSGKSAADFFEKNYRKIWNTLEKNEQFAVAFSSNLFLINSAFPLSFDYSKKFKDSKMNPARILKDSWGITNYEELIAAYNRLQTDSQSHHYKEIEVEMDLNPGKTALEISTIKGYSAIGVARSFFVEKVRNILGVHGIEAWDQGRAITILRWGIASGYISREEAMELMEPIISDIRSNYVSLTDYMYHYIAGRCFFGLDTGDYVNMVNNAKVAYELTAAYIPVFEIEFTSENADYEHVCLNFKYIPDDEARNWESFVALLNRNYQKEEFFELEKSLPKLPCVVYNHILLLTDNNLDEEACNYIEENMEMINELKETNGIYVNVQYRYLKALNNLYRPADCLDCFEKLPVSLQENLYVFYQRAYANYLMSTIAKDFESQVIYQSRAVNDFKKLKQRGLKLNTFLENWIKSVDIL